MYEPVFWDIEATTVNPIAQEWQDGMTHDARVIAVGIGTLYNWRGAESFDDVECSVEVLWDEDEYRLLSVAKKRLGLEINALRTSIREGDMDKELEDIILTGWNSRLYDHPYICARYGRYRQDPGRFATTRRLDMMRVGAGEFGRWGYGLRQDEYARYLGIEIEDDTDGSDMPGFYSDGEWDKIEYHCKEDVLVMMEIFFKRRNRCMNHFFNHYDIRRDANYVKDVEIES